MPGPKPFRSITLCLKVDGEEWDELYTINGVPIKLGTDSERELDELDLQLEDLVLGIKYGTPCPDAWERAKGHYEACFRYGDMIVRVVYIKSYWFDNDCECIFVKHIGRVP